MKLLCVDSEPIYREIVSVCAKGHGLDVKTATTFQEAIDLFEDWEPDLVTLDVLVKGGNGLVLIRELKLKANGRFVPMIFLSSQSSDSTMEKCFSAGADDFLPKPFQEALFNTRIESHKRQIMLVQEMSQKNRELVYYKAMIEREHKMAHQVLDHVLIRCENTDHNVAVTRLSAASFNGDLALVNSRSDGARLIFVGDFTGHGLSASIGALPVAQAFFDAVDDHIEISKLASHINRMLISILPDYMFCAAYIVLIKPGGHLFFWGGGMPKAYIRRQDGRLDYLQSMHMPLGILGPSEFDNTLGEFSIAAEDTLVIATDGVSELKNEAGEMLGAESLEALVSACYANADLNQAQEDLKNKLSQYQGHSEQIDDITFVAVRKKVTENKR